MPTPLNGGLKKIPFVNRRKVGALNNPSIPQEGCRKVFGILSKLADRSERGLKPLLSGV